MCKDALRLTVVNVILVGYIILIVNKCSRLIGIL